MGNWFSNPRSIIPGKWEISRQSINSPLEGERHGYSAFSGRLNTPERSDSKEIFGTFRRLLHYLRATRRHEYGRICEEYSDGPMHTVVNGTGRSFYGSTASSTKHNECKGHEKRRASARRQILQ
ncbi:uncharacterized protein LOC106175258 [Lingula anatina]|uniref:Uncharacterized protein LOC106175258 n=1 Tax=Lingula anatina TaxID=7574 RepID=A0A1S3JRA4_LINAN|nr:uncharacterized protein LOC106175258 [Lingula anatina]|eukprot:XP_013412621.1 uncharacterized protein LOC106175258 [Lingula anatina]